MPSFKIIELLVLEKKIFKGFYHVWAWWPSWSCGLDHLYNLSFPLPKEAAQKIGFDWPSGFRGEEIVNGRRTYDGRTPDPWVSYKLTIGSGELQRQADSFCYCGV